MIKKSFKIAMNPLGNINTVWSRWLRKKSNRLKFIIPGCY